MLGVRSAIHSARPVARWGLVLHRARPAPIAAVAVSSEPSPVPVPPRRLGYGTVVPPFPRHDADGRLRFHDPESGEDLPAHEEMRDREEEEIAARRVAEARLEGEAAVDITRLSNTA